MITETPPTDGSYYPQGEHVRKAAKVGPTGATLGFCVGRMQDEEYAPFVAKAMNAYAHVERAARLLQAKAHMHHRLAAVYIYDAGTAKGRYSSSIVKYVEQQNLADARREQIDAAAASLAARQLMGIE